jgi:hypothetical protein
MNLWKLTNEWQLMLSLLDNYDNLTGEEMQELNSLQDQAQQDLTAFLAQGLDAKDMLGAQLTYAQEKISELTAIRKRLEQQTKRVDDLLKQAVTMTNQKAVAIGANTLSVKKTPAKLIIDDDADISDEYKQISITLPLHVAKIVAFEYDLDIDWSKAETLKSEIKKLMTAKENPIEFAGCRLVSDTRLEVK